MKLRIKGDSIRIRLSKTEVALLCEGAQVIEVLHFTGGAKLEYAVAPDYACTSLSATFENNRVAVKMPYEQAVSWAKSHAVAFKSDSQTPFILVEKDFQCLKPRVHESEDESDLYYNPNELHGQCT